jgi:hypothetical protein
MNSPTKSSFALVNIRGGEIILILVLLLILAVAAFVLIGLIYLILRAFLGRRPPTPSTLPPDLALKNQQHKDREHIKLLAIFHFVFAGLAFVGIGFLCVHYVIMHTVYSNPDMWKSQPQTMPKAFLDAFIWFYLFMGIILLTGLVLNVLSGFFLLQRRNRVFSLVIGGLNCLQIPVWDSSGSVYHFGAVPGKRTRVIFSPRAKPGSTRVVQDNTLLKFGCERSQSSHSTESVFKRPPCDCSQNWDSIPL